MEPRDFVYWLSGIVGAQDCCPSHDTWELVTETLEDVVAQMEVREFDRCWITDDETEIDDALRG